MVVSGVGSPFCSLVCSSRSLVCGLFPGFLVVVVVVVAARTVVLVSSFVAARIGGSLDSGSWVRVPPWWVGVGETARGGQVPGQTLSPPAELSSSAVGPKKDHFHFGVCVSVVAPSYK